MVRGQGPEFDFVIAACLDPGNRGSAAAALPLDWDLLRRISARHRVDGLVWQKMNALGAPPAPGAVRADFERSFRQQTFAYLAQLGETLRLTSLLEAKGYRVITLKGCALGHELYQPLPQARHSSDIDLLVDPKDFAAVCAILRTEGYTQEMPDRAMPPSADSMARYLSNAFEYNHPARGIKVELHHRLLSDPETLVTPFAELLSRARWVPVGNGRVRCLGSEDLFVYLCCHAARHAFFRLKWLADIAIWLERGPKLDFAAVFARARGVGGARHVRLTGCMLEALTGRKVYNLTGNGRDRVVTRLAGPALQAVTRLDEIPAQFRLADVPDNLRDLSYGWRLATSWRSRAFQILTHLCNHKDLMIVKRGVEWRWLYAVIGRPLALWRYGQRLWGGRRAVDQGNKPA